jgi:hypothetical protein
VSARNPAAAVSDLEAGQRSPVTLDDPCRVTVSLPRRLGAWTRFLIEHPGLRLLVNSRMPTRLPGAPEQTVSEEEQRFGRCPILSSEMTGGDRSVEDRFARIAKGLSDREGVAVGSTRRGFGSDALTVDGRIFAMVSQGRLVLKLPRDRVAALITSGDGLPFDAGKGRPMKEWIVLTDRSSRRWPSLAGEACTFVGGNRP